jgi:electron transfer flavoprotein-quinone oxidoreductase
MKTYAKAPHFLENPRMYAEYPRLAADILRGVYNLDMSPRKHLLATACTAFRASGLKVHQLVRDGWSALRAL